MFYKLNDLKISTEASSVNKFLFNGVAECSVCRLMGYLKNVCRSLFARIDGDIRFNNADTSNVKKCVEHFHRKL